MLARCCCRRLAQPLCPAKSAKPTRWRIHRRFSPANGRPLAACGASAAVRACGDCRPPASCARSLDARPRGARARHRRRRARSRRTPPPSSCPRDGPSSEVRKTSSVSHVAGKAPRSTRFTLATSTWTPLPLRDHCSRRVDAPPEPPSRQHRLTHRCTPHARCPPPRAGSGCVVRASGPTDRPAQAVRRR